MFDIFYDEGAEEDLRTFRPFEVRRILDEVDGQLTREPMRPTRRRKLLEGLIPPWDSVRPVWQLRIGAFRVFCDVDPGAGRVIIRAVRRKGTRRTEDIL
jgi:mRNA-degrading endonuclease RelE of RelBE toxin-antitoxin system